MIGLKNQNRSGAKTFNVQSSVSLKTNWRFTASQNWQWIMKDQAICWLNYSVLWVLGVPLHLGVFPFILILQNLKLMRNTAGRAGSVNNICGWAAADMEIKCGDLTPFPWDIPYMAKCMLKPLQRTEFECFQGRLLLILHHGEGPFCSWLYQRTPSQLYKDIVGPVWCEGTRVAWTEPWPQPYWTPLGFIGTPVACQVLASCIGTGPHKCSFG